MTDRRSPAVPAAAVLLLAAGLASPSAPAAAAERDPEAVAVAERTLAALGGQQAWDATRYLSFGFAGRRSHWWDRATGRHRVEGTTGDGEPYVVLHDLDSRQGRAWLGGDEVTGERAAELLENAYGAWVNDTYWLLAPYKLLDPGVELAYGGEATIDGTVYQVLELSFESVGLTPGDRYWVYVERDSGLVGRWAYVLEDQPADAEPTAWRWVNWQRYGGIMLADRREQVGTDRVLDLSPIAVPESLPDSVFESPAPVVATADGE